MSVDVAPEPPMRDFPRAGFWRRFWSTVLDTIIVMLPFQFIAAIMFALTAGTIQMTGGFYSACFPDTTVPESLVPAPPHDSNFSQICRSYFFGFPTGTILTVGRNTKENSKTTTISQTYMLDANDKQIDGTSINQIYELAFVIYLIEMASRRGRSLGDRALRIRVMDVSHPQNTRVPLGKVIIRYLAMTIGYLPFLAVLGYFDFIAEAQTADAIFTLAFFRSLSIVGIVSGIWTIFLIVQIALKKDPVYDRLAGTAVVRNNSAIAA